jgi:hypothetical protein
MWGVEMATTFCPTCGERVEHAPDWTISLESEAGPERTQTKFIANRTLVIHMCTQVDAKDDPITA